MSRRSVIDPRFGEKLKQLREARGLSLRALGARAYYGKSYIQQLEQHLKAPTAEVATRLDAAMQANGELEATLSAATPGDAILGGAGDQEELWWGSRGVIETIARMTSDDLVLNRREAIGSLIMGASLLEPLDRWLEEASPSTLPARRTRRVGKTEIAQLERTAILFRQWDDQFGGGLRRKAVVGQLNAVTELLGGSHAPGIEQQLLGVIARLGETAATMAWDSGDGATAQQYYMLALRVAREGNDRAFAANVLAAMARQLLYLDQASDAIELVRLAQDSSAGHATAKVRAMLHTREAWAYAKLGRITAFRRATDRAHEAIAEAGADDEPYWINYFGEAELAGVTGGRLLELAHQRRELAVEAAEQIHNAVELRDPHHLRSLALDKVGVAEARLLQGEAEEAARLGHEAVEIAEQTPSDRVRCKLAEFHATTRDHSAAAVVDLRNRLELILA